MVHFQPVAAVRKISCRLRGHGQPIHTQRRKFGIIVGDVQVIGSRGKGHCMKAILGRTCWEKWDNNCHLLISQLAYVVSQSDLVS